MQEKIFMEIRKWNLLKDIVKVSLVQYIEKLLI